MKQWVHYINKGEILTEETADIEETYEITDQDTPGNKLALTTIMSMILVLFSNFKIYNMNSLPVD